MSSADDSELYECQICLTDMMDQSPRTLHCLHTFCESCLTKLLKNWTITCPTCRAVTGLMQNDVRQLPINFILGRMKRRKEAFKKEKDTITKKMNVIIQEKDNVTKRMNVMIEEMEKSVQENLDCRKEKQENCEICESYKGSYTCVDCVQIMCSLCKAKHDNIPHFKDHSVHQIAHHSFCEKHSGKVTHACLQCGRKLCNKCMILDHTEHKESYEKLEKAVQIFRVKIQKFRNITKNRLFNAVNNLEALENNYCTTEQVKEMYQQRLDELNHLCEDTQNTISANKEALAAEETLIVKIDNFMESDSDDVCSVFEHIRAKMEQNKTNFGQIASQNLVFETGITQTVPLVEPVKNIKLESTGLERVKMGFSFESPLVSFGDNVALRHKAKSNSDYMIRIDSCGRIVTKYYPHIKKQNIIDATTYSGNLYMAQKAGITVLSNSNQQFYNIPLRDGCKIAVLDFVNILLTQQKTDSLQRGLFKFNIDDGLMEITEPHLMNPFDIKIIRKSSGPQYLILDCTDVALIRVLKLFDEDWNHLWNIGDEHVPGVTYTITDMNTVLLAPFDMKISHYKLDGTLLPEIKGNGNATVMEYRNPYLWVFYNNVLYCFKITKILDDQSNGAIGNELSVMLGDSF